MPPDTDGHRDPEPARPTTGHPVDLPQPAACSPAADALAAAARFGPHFTVAVADEAPARDGWQPVAALYAGDHGRALAALLTEAARRLDTDVRRVAGSILHQGFAARLWSSTLAAALHGGVVPQLTEHALYWRSTPASLLELLAVAPTGQRAPDDLAQLAELVRAASLDAHTARLADAVGAATSVSSTILAGNTASALVGTLRVLVDTGLDAQARTVARALLDDEALRDTGTFDLDATPPWLRRASCCLFYRTPGGGLCGDCVLADR